MSFESRIIQLTSVYSLRFSQVVTDTVWFHIALHLTEATIHDVTRANQVMFQAFTIQGVFGFELQLTAIFCELKSLLATMRIRGDIYNSTVKMMMILMTVMIMMMLIMTTLDNTSFDQMETYFVMGSRLHTLFKASSYSILCLKLTIHSYNAGRHKIPEHPV